MSDLSIYELEDIIWDDFEHNGDHIVPDPTEDHGSEDKCEGDSCKKPRREVTPHKSNEGNLYASGSVCQVKEERDSMTLNEERNMMEENSWSHIPDGVLAASGDADAAKDMPSLQSGAADSNSYNYPPSQTCQSDDLNLFSNDGNDKDSSDLLYYGWPDIGNFEDVDRMLSNCDSSFGLGVTGNDDELVWFISEDPAGGYEEALKMDLKFPCSEPSALSNVSQDQEPRESDDKKSSFVSESKDEYKLKDQKEQSSQQNYGLTSTGNWLQHKNLGHDAMGYMQSSAYTHPVPGHDHVPIQSTGGPVMTGIRSKNKGPTSPSQKETSNASSQVHSMESYGDPLFQRTRAHAIQPSFSGSQGQIIESQTKIESQSDKEGVKKGFSTEFDSLDVPEGSSISSELDEISLEATSFRQLQQVMEQLDLRTKLCIRDSLYRLARSAEQRHNYAGISNSTTNCGGTGGPLMTEGTNKCTGFMDMETDTNPIDRTIAHLLFHRPSDSSNMPTPLPLKPNAKVRGSTTGPPMVTEKLSCQEESANESGDKISSV